LGGRTTFRSIMSNTTGKASKAGIALHDGTAEQKLRDLRQMYEPHVQRLSKHLLMSLPPWLPVTGTPDIWQMTAWEGWRPRSTR